MAYTYHYCFYMSLRLGSIIVGVFSFIQGLCKMIVFSIAITDLDAVSKIVKIWKEENNLTYMTSFFEYMIQDPNNIILTLLIFSTIYTLSCTILIFGAFTFRTYMIYPYVLIELIRLIALFGIHIIGMTLIKENVINLGLLIGLSVFGGFILLGLFYNWFCTLNLAMVINELTKEIETVEMSNYPNKPSKIQQNIYTLQNNNVVMETIIDTNNVMAELHLIGEIASAYGFGNHSLFCRYSIQGGPNWRVISGNCEGQTAADSPLYEGPSVWSHPIDIHFSSKGIQGWPKILLQIYCLDYIGRYWIKGYAIVAVPSTPGLHVIKAPCWVPSPISIYEKVSQFFLGGGNQLLSPDTLFTGKDRYKLKTYSEGTVKLNLEVILKDFSKYGVEYK